MSITGVTEDRKHFVICNGNIIVPTHNGVEINVQVLANQQQTQIKVYGRRNGKWEILEIVKPDGETMMEE